MNFNDIYRDKTVLVTGHTGFKGPWLCEWLLLLGAKVVGFALEPPTEPAHFSLLRLDERLTADIRADVRDLQALQQTLQRFEPDIIFHLAAQSVVRRSFDDPHYTVEANLLGTLNVLEAVRRAGRDCVLIMITTDKVYENVEWTYAYRENDVLGGHDPYSASKTCAEAIISAYQRSFFNLTLDDPQTPTIAVASARGGNAIGGGDWTEDAIVPDCMRSLSRNEIIPIRNSSATRPWQHVLQLLGGYLHLGAEIFGSLYLTDCRDSQRLQALCSAFNFAPRLNANRTVGELVQEILKHWPGRWEDRPEPNTPHEASKLQLASDKAYHWLDWEPQWDFEETIKQTVIWYLRYYKAENRDAKFVQALTQWQITLYADAMNRASSSLN